MEIRSSIVEAKVMHDRKKPKRNRFRYGIFTFQMDLDDLSSLNSKFRLLGRNRARIFSFYDSDHLGSNQKDIKENITEYLRMKGVKEEIRKILLVTNLRVFGYVFNPVSFYFAYDAKENPICAVAEVQNTFGELKPYFFGKEDYSDETFRKVEAKHFYVSPFIALDSEFDFRLSPPKRDRLNLRIDAIESGEKVLVTTYSGTYKKLTDLALLWMLCKYPFVTLKVIFLIHWQAMKLYLHKIPFIRKQERLHLQKGVQLGKDHR
ncbi:hypothetical protein CH373_07720 [Leptospira perolatii]|uniref:DUF1365 domain-containing protein n=1 Tax=Leptospira perolatii TaxID=2023191 RepID=A0A2M9ZPT8_9LEPT|nr:DUF1365 domain-containing protein [Leptospira perolatii]PJZ70791.1 hypothetical protein CH360_04580 [Leptospira perolatii]PJZ73999.1 hypothetical protein CH373_07720 [Leptospira perolatii]